MDDLGWKLPNLIPRAFPFSLPFFFGKSPGDEVRNCDTVLWAVSGNSRDGGRLNKQTWRRKSNGGTISQNLLINLAEFLFYRILHHENFKMEDKRTNFVSHLIITVQLYY